MIKPNDIYEFLYDLDKKIIQLDRQKLIKEIFKFISSELKLKRLSLAIKNDQKNGFVITDVVHEIENIEEGKFIPYSNIYFTQKIDKGVPLYRPDISRYEPKFEVDFMLLDGGMKSDFVVPLVVAGKCIGSLNCGSDHVDGIAESKRKILTLIAPKIAIAFRNAVLYESLQNSEEKYRLFIENNHLNILFIDPDSGEIINVNRSAHEFYGFKDKSLIGKNINEINTLPEAEIKKKLVAAKKKNLNYFNFKHKLANGDVKDVEIHQSSLKIDGRNIFSIIVNDISERIKIENALRESEELFFRLFQTSPNIITLSDLQSGRMIDINEAGLIALGINKEEIVNNTSLNLGLLEQSERDILLKHIFEKGYYNDVELDIRLPNGELRKGLFHGKVLKYKDTDCLFQTIIDITDIKKVENELKQSQDRFRYMSELIPQIIFEFDLKGRLQYINKHGLETFGYEKDDIEEGVTVTSFLIPDHRGKAKKGIQKLLKEKKIVKDEYSAVKFDGTVFPILVHINLINRNNDPIGFRGTITDISDIKKVEKELKERQTVLQAIFDSTGDGLLVVDKKGRVTHRNAEFDRMWNIPEELKNETDDNKLLAYVVRQVADPELFINRINDLYKSDKAEKDIINFKDGRIFERTTRPLVLESSIAGRLWGFSDITASKQAEQARIESEKRFKSLFESLGDAVFVTSVGGENKGAILEVNYEATIQTGYTREELLNMNIINDLLIKGTGNLDEDHWEERLTKGEIVRTGEMKRKKNGQTYWTEVIVSPIVFKGEKASLSINHDITQLKEAQEELLDHREHLEVLVKERTSELKTKNDELERLNNLFVGREFRIKELREQVKSMEIEIKRLKRYRLE